MSFADAGAEKSKVEMCAFEIFKLVFLSFPLFNFLADARAEKKKFILLLNFHYLHVTSKPLN